MKNLLLVLTLSIAFSSISQTRIDGTFPFQTDPNKKYSLFIPSGYVPGTANNLMLGLHPYNPSRWNAKSWCDTLVDFAEANQLILICPDGGVDGKIDDAIDTAFTTALLDSVQKWYTINDKRIYVMGFSWGGLTTYKYGLSNPTVFAGYMPIGAAINGTSPISGILNNANNKGFYVVHGGSDSPGTRYTPLINGLNSNGAILKSILMPGVGHTIDFPNRNQILTTAYLWLDSVRTTQISNVSINENQLLGKIYPTVLSQEISQVKVEIPGIWIGQNILLYNAQGKLVSKQKISETKFFVKIPETAGVYYVVIGDSNRIEKIVRY